MNEVIQVTEKETEEKTEGQKKSKYIKINEEITYRKIVSGIEVYERFEKKRMKRKDGTKFFAGGLEEEDFEHIPKEDQNFVLTETNHLVLLTLLSSPGFKSILLSGDSGLGKTATVEQIAARMKMPLIRDNITGETKVSDILQKENFDKQEQKIIYEDKGLVTAMQKGYWYLVDEVSAGSPQIMFVFFRLLEKAEVRTFDGRTIKAHPMFKIIFTDNRIGNPNFYRYHGTHEQNLSFLNRITSTIFFKNLKPSLEERIMKKRYDVDNEFLKPLMEFAKTLREENRKGNFQELFSTRQLESICLNYEILKDPQLALSLGYTNKITDSGDQEFVEALFQRIFGNSKMNNVIHEKEESLTDFEIPMKPLTI